MENVARACAVQKQLKLTQVLNCRIPRVIRHDLDLYQQQFDIPVTPDEQEHVGLDISDPATGRIRGQRNPIDAINEAAAKARRGNSVGNRAQDLVLDCVLVAPTQVAFAVASAAADSAIQWDHVVYSGPLPARRDGQLPELVEFGDTRLLVDKTRPRIGSQIDPTARPSSEVARCHGLAKVTRTNKSRR